MSYDSDDDDSILENNRSTGRSESVGGIGGASGRGNNEGEGSNVLERVLKEKQDLEKQLRQEMKNQKEQILTLMKKNEQMVAALKVRGGNNRGASDVLDPDDEFDVNDRRKQLVGVLREYVFPQIKWQTDYQLFTYDPNTVGKIVMDKLKIDEDERCVYWNNSQRIVKQLFREYRHGVSRRTKTRVIEELVKEEDAQCEDFKKVWKQEKMKDLEEFVHSSEDIYFSFVNFFISAAVGMKRWEKTIRRELNIGGRLEDNLVLTPSDEAFVILEIENRWKNYRDEATYRKDDPARISWKYKIPSKHAEKFSHARWTSTEKENKDGEMKNVSCEWNEDGLDRYCKILNKCCEWREGAGGGDTRKKLVEYIKKSREGASAKKKRKACVGVTQEKDERRKAVEKKKRLIERCSQLVEV